MNPLLFAGVLAAPPLVGAASGSPDIGSSLIAYGVAAPFAVVLWTQLQRAQKREAELEARIVKMQEDAVARERALAGQVGSMLYDGAVLYREGNARLVQGLEHTQNPPELQSLIAKMENLVERMEEEK